MAMRRHWKHWRKHWKVHPESLPYYILLWLIQLIGVCGLPLNACSKSLTKTLKLDTRTVSSRVDLIWFHWLWHFFNIAIIYTDETIPFSKVVRLELFCENSKQLKAVNYFAESSQPATLRFQANVNWIWMRFFTYNRNQFVEAYIIYLYVNIITKSENDHFNSNKIIV